ncbi:MAG: Fur family transcriptional regulator [Burkholderiales bacterium]|nr:Fur family transcriptional regulator [Burkholderiales bacterium]
MPAKSSHTSTPTAATRKAAADSLIREAGARLTGPRSAVLTRLLAADHAMTHQEITDALAADQAVDRVTVYRVLEWLVEQGLAHRIAGEDRVWRFSVSRGKVTGGGHDHRHAHFACTQCGQTFCLGDMPADVKVKLPAGFRTEAVELTLRGVCGHCR